MDIELNRKQQIQEDEYCFPYHYLDLYPRCRYWLLTDQSYRTIVRSLLGEPCDRRLLDAGCGDGRLCYELAQGGWDVVGIDYSERAIAFAKAFSPTVKFIVGDLAKYQPEKQFDVVTCVEVIEHIIPIELPNVIMHISRCLKNDGTLILTVPSINISVTSKHYQHFSPDELAQVLSPYFEITQISGHLRMGLKRKLYKLLLIIGIFLTPLVGRRVSQPFFTRLRRLLDSIQNCPPEVGERLIAVCRKTVV